MDPYRASAEAPPRHLTLHPDASPWIAIVAAIGFTAMASVMMDRGARVIHAECVRNGESVACATKERTLFTSESRSLEARRLNGFDVQRQRLGKNTTEWIAVDAQEGSGSLTGPGLPSIGREKALEALNAFARDPNQASVSVSVGAIWGGLGFVGLLLPFALVLYAILGNRTTVTLLGRRHVRVQSRLWPLPPRGIDFDPEELGGFDTDRSSKGNTRIVVVLANGTRFPLTQSYTSSNKSEAMMRMEAFIRGKDVGA